VRVLRYGDARGVSRQLTRPERYIGRRYLYDHFPALYFATDSPANSRIQQLTRVDARHDVNSG